MSILKIFKSYGGRAQHVCRVKISLYHRHFINQVLSIKYTHKPTSVNCLSHSVNYIEIHSPFSEFIMNKKKRLYFILCIDKYIYCVFVLEELNLKIL